jgi:hypothetical protein
VFGNRSRSHRSRKPAAELRIEGELQLETYVVERPQSEIAPEAASYLFTYSADHRIDLGTALKRHHADPSDRLGAGVRAFVRGSLTAPSHAIATIMAASIIPPHGRSTTREISRLCGK